MSQPKPVFIPIKGRVLVLFSGKNCPHCEAIKPLLVEELMRRPGTSYMVVNPTDEHQLALYRQYGVRMAPTVVAFNDGAELGRFAGFRNQADIATVLNRWNVQ